MAHLLLSPRFHSDCCDSLPPGGHRPAESPLKTPIFSQDAENNHSNHYQDGNGRSTARVARPCPYQGYASPDRIHDPHSRQCREAEPVTDGPHAGQPVRTVRADPAAIASLAPRAARGTWYPNCFTSPTGSNEPNLSSELATVGRTVERLTDSDCCPDVPAIALGVGKRREQTTRITLTRASRNTGCGRRPLPGSLSRHRVCGA